MEKGIAWACVMMPINKNEIMIHMEKDKKNIGGELNFILLNKLGNAIIKPNFNKKLIKEALDIL